ncbi:hypothetical protein L599_005900000140 [Luteimonas sp. J16]|jgi:hypothetical protein|nr:hypothetical protein L599_005900000140 [Luteimonas sp. J16]
MGVVGKAPGWQRAVSALLTLGFAWAFATRALDGGLGAWPEVVVMLVALYGGYLFGYFAWRGRLPGRLAGMHGRRPRGGGDA